MCVCELVMCVSTSKVDFRSLQKTRKYVCVNKVTWVFVDMYISDACVCELVMGVCTYTVICECVLYVFLIFWCV